MMDSAVNPGFYGKTEIWPTYIWLVSTWEKDQLRFFFKRDCTCPTRKCSPTWTGIQYAISTEILPINGDFTDNRPIWPTSAFRQHWCQDGMVGKIILSMNLENHTLVLPENHSLPKRIFAKSHQNSIFWKIFIKNHTSILGAPKNCHRFFPLVSLDKQSQVFLVQSAAGALGARVHSWDVPRRVGYTKIL